MKPTRWRDIPKKANKLISENFRSLKNSSEILEFGNNIFSRAAEKAK